MMAYNELKYIQHSVPALKRLCSSVIVMDNGSVDGSIEYLESAGVELIINQQTFPPDYSVLTNELMSHVPDGEMMLRLAPDEYPSNAMFERLGDYIKEGTGLIGLYHLMKSPRSCMPIEYPVYHQRIFRKSASLKYSGNVHEQANYPRPWYQVPVETGIALVHFSYLEEERLRMKSAMYSRIPNSGFNTPDALASRLNLETKPLPDFVQYDLENTFAKEICNGS
jgi:glycosyltransferase involved in cell wall biosynthesis